MEIEFNTNRIAKADYGEGVTRPATSATGDNSAAFSASSLADKLNQIPLARPEKVEHGAKLVSHQHYPPDDLLDRIATLLALHVKQ